MRLISITYNTRRAGFSLVETLVVISIIGILLAILLVGVQKIREASNRLKCQNNLKQLALACHHVESNSGSFPPGYVHCGRIGMAPYWQVSGSQGGTFGNGRAETYGPPWVMHLAAEMEQQTIAERIRLAIISEDLIEACPWDNIDGLPERRPEIDIQTSLRKFMTCPSSIVSDVQFNAQSIENNLKGNYAASFGGNAHVDGTPDPSALKQFAGVFQCVKGEYSVSDYSRRLCIGKGTTITDIRDGTSQTVLMSEVLNWMVPDSRVSKAAPAGMNKDPRGAILCPTTGANTFTGKFPPNSFQTDVLIDVADNIPATDPMRAIANQKNGQIWAAARSKHLGGVNASFADGSVRFIRNSIDQNLWSALNTIANGEIENPD